MQDHKRRAQSLGEINRLKCLLGRTLSFLRWNSRKLVTVGRSHHDFDRQRTKIMQTAEANLPGIEHFLNSRYQRHASTVAELNQVKPKFGFDFAQHHVAGGMASGVPTGGKRYHLVEVPSRSR